MCPAKEMSNCKKIKPGALAVIELRLSEGIGQSVSQLVSRKFHLIIQPSTKDNTKCN